MASTESRFLAALDEDELDVLRHGAVLRYITPELAELATGTAGGAEELIGHPLLRPSGTRHRGELWTMPELLRRELVRGWETGAAAAWQRVATSGDELESTYALLAVESTRSEGLQRLEAEFIEAIDDPNGVGRAHDLLRLLDEWPVGDDAGARATRDRLSPRLRRHSRALRDREATSSYFERDFERGLLDLLLDGGDQWVLQLHAPGGRGKSMYLKNLLGRTCPGRDIPVAWIDFDRIDRLGVNTAQPWRLLLTVARQLDPQLPSSPFSFMLDSYGRFAAAAHTVALPRQQSAEAATAGTSSDDEVLHDAADHVPRKFRSELASVLGDGVVIVAIDTVENVLDADGAEIDPLLSVLDDVRHGGTSPGDDGVPGLRVLLCGRFDLAGERMLADGSPRPRSVAFRQQWMGDDVEDRHIADDVVRVGREAISFELPPFSDDEARTFLASRGLDAAVVDAAVQRAGGNAMKLDLLAEFVEENPLATADEILDLESVELAYLVTRVVDRIPDGRVQWLLRWGALLEVLTRDAVEQIIWPGLVELVALGTAYDDASTDRAPAPAPGVVRWHRPSSEDVSGATSVDEAWEGLLGYAARSSWVSMSPDVPDAVFFHPEVREPLRALLRSRGLPAFDDVHRRATKYWQVVASDASGTVRALALRSLVFHAYESSGDPAHGDDTWRSLLAVHRQRADRGELAAELLAVERRHLAAGRLPPSPEVVALAHCERAEALVHDAVVNGRPVDEGALSTHRRGIPADVRGASPRRTTFLDAVMADARFHVDDAWGLLDDALRQPVPHDDELDGLELIVEWAARLATPSGALETARLLANEAEGTRLEATAAVPLARSLLSAEQWSEALGAARTTGRPALIAQALLALGRTDEVIGDRSAFSPEERARAALLHLDAPRALRALATSASVLPDPATPTVQLIRGRAHALLRDHEPARAALSEAASGADPAIAVEANLMLARLMAIAGDSALAVSSLARTMLVTDPVATARATALAAVIRRDTDPVRSGDEVREAYAQARALAGVAPSVFVELECARLAVLGATPPLLADLASALSSVDGAAARLQALRWFGDVPIAERAPPRRLAAELRTLTEIPIGPPTPASLLLARAELERVLGNQDEARRMLDVIAGAPAATLVMSVRLALDDALHRLDDATTGWRSFELGNASQAPIGATGHGDRAATVRISSARTGSGMVVDVDDDDHASTHTWELACPTPVEAPYTLAAAPTEVVDQLATVLDTSHGGHGAPAIELLIGDDAASRWPWEIAARHGGLLRTDAADGVVLIRRSHEGPGSPGDFVESTVRAVVLNDRKDRSHIVEALSRAYGRTARVLRDIGSRDSAEATAATWSSARVVHLVADPIERRRAPVLQTTRGDLVTPESLGEALGGGQGMLLVLDLVLHESDTAAAEQLMIANAFCWHLVRNARDVSVLCGSFAATEGRTGRLTRLAAALERGVTPVELLRELRSATPSGHPLRDCVSVSTDAPQRRFRTRTAG